jgi:hypothetical protein
LDWSSWSNTLAAKISGPITLLDFFLQGLMKQMIYWTKVHMAEELLHQIMDAAAYI